MLLTNHNRYIGASSMYAWEFQALQNVAERHGFHKFISMQNFYNLTYREEEREMSTITKVVLQCLFAVADMFSPIL